MECLARKRAKHSITHYLSRQKNGRAILTNRLRHDEFDHPIAGAGGFLAHASAVVF